MHDNGIKSNLIYRVVNNVKLLYYREKREDLMMKKDRDYLLGLLNGNVEVLSRDIYEDERVRKASREVMALLDEIRGESTAEEEIALDLESAINNEVSETARLAYVEGMRTGARLERILCGRDEVRE